MQFITENEQINNFDDQDRVFEALQHLFRDWSLEGLHERIGVKETVEKTIDQLFPDRELRKEGPVRILLPGSGLGRAANDIAQMQGVEVTANELSSYMRLAYRFVETVSIPFARTVHPFIDWWSYQPNREELFRETKFPDVPINASQVLLVEGDFTKVFVNHTAHFDVVFTNFFMDTAPNMMNYIDTMVSILKPGGVWINIGPMLYHRASVEFSLEDIMAVAEEYGFEFLDVDEEWGPLVLKNRKARYGGVSYLCNENALRYNTYKATFFAARLRTNPESVQSSEEKKAKDEL
jgi:MFS transporter, ACS family, DAL5 transporter family protein